MLSSLIAVSAAAPRPHAPLTAMAAHQAAAQHPPVFIVHYHKTGAVASGELTTIISNVLAQPCTDDPGPKRYHPPSGCFDYDFESEPFIRQAGPDFLCNVSEAYPADVKFFHLMRNPFDLAISSYLYHAEGQEATAKWSDDIICQTNMSTLPQFAQLTGVSLSDLQKVVALCNDLMDSTKGSGTYLERLQHQPHDIGLRLNTARATISFGTYHNGPFDTAGTQAIGGGADELRIPANVVSLAQLPPGNVFNFYEPQWSDPDQVRSFVADVVDIMEPTMAPATKAQKEEEIMRIYCATSPLFNDDCTVAEDPEDEHVTSGELSDEERQKLLQMLRDDDVLGPVLLRVEQIVCGTDAALAGRPEFAAAAKFCPL